MCEELLFNDFLPDSHQSGQVSGIHTVCVVHVYITIFATFLCIFVMYWQEICLHKRIGGIIYSAYV